LFLLTWASFENAKKRPLLCPQFFLLAAFFGAALTLSAPDVRFGSKAQLLAWHLASVAHDETAVDVDGLARHVIGVTVGEKAHDASHVFRSFGSPERDQ
jgi:hypothetical protein